MRIKLTFATLFVAIAGLFLSACNSSSTSPASAKASAPVEKQVAAPKTWVKVYEFKGNGTKKSSLFELTGGAARLKYNYTGNKAVNIGMFAAYVVDEGKDILREGGFPEVMSQTVSDQSETSLQKPAGKYYLDVKATGKWEIIIEEEK